MKNFLRNSAFAKVVVLALAVLAVFPALAHSQTCIGKFTLAAETHWGTAVLTPGDYEFSLDTSSAPSKVTVRRADGGLVAAVIPMWISSTDSVTDNHLQLKTQGDEVFISALYLDNIDTELHFAVPKAKKDVLAGQAGLRSSTIGGPAQ